MLYHETLKTRSTPTAPGDGPIASVNTATATRNDTTCGVVARDGVRLFVQQWGSGQPVLFVHSWSLSSDMWAGQFVEFAAAGLRCVAYDRRGHGRSDLPSAGYEMNSLADDLASVIDGLGLHDVVLVGHSMGCAEIARYLARHGAGRIAKVILLAPTTPFLLEAPDNPYGAPLSVWNAVRREMSADFPRWIEDNKLPFFTHETSPAAMDWLAGLMVATPLPVALATHHAFTEFDFRPDLAGIDVPTLILHGDNDASAPLEFTGRRTAAAIEGAVLKVYPGAPHGLFFTHAKQVNDDILTFVRS